jgi:hypothetical protein
VHLDEACPDLVGRQRVARRVFCEQLETLQVQPETAVGVEDNCIIGGWINLSPVLLLRLPLVPYLWP